MILIRVRCHSKAEHDGQNGDSLDDIGDDTDDGIADGILRANHIVVYPADQFTYFGVGKETQGHTLQAGKQSHPQIVNYAFTDSSIQSPLQNIDSTAHGRDE